MFKEVPFLLDTINQVRKRCIKELIKEDVVKMVSMFKGFFMQIIWGKCITLYIHSNFELPYIDLTGGWGSCLATV